MNDSQQGRDDEARIGAVLSALGETQPAEGLQERVLRRLATEPARQPRGVWMPRFAADAAFSPMRFAVTAAVVIFGLGGLIQVLHRPKVAPVSGVAAVSNEAPRGIVAPASPHAAASRQVLSAATNVAAQGEGRAAAFARSANGTGGSHARGQQGEDATLRETAANHGSAREPSYPAPEMPLTEQERLLLQIAHRNDPVQVAMLDPVERNLAHARERAETTQFFKPEPLPPELQEQVKAALRSQYVNTPPPSDLLASTADRSTP